MVSGVHGIEDVGWSLAVADDADKWGTIAQSIDGFAVGTLTDSHNDAGAWNKQRFSIGGFTEKALGGNFFTGTACVNLHIFVNHLHEDWTLANVAVNSKRITHFNKMNRFSLLA